MALADIVVADATPANVTFSVTSVNGPKAVYSDASRNADKPRIATFSHQSAGSAVARRNRHLVRIDRTEVDADGNVGVVSVYVVIDMSAKVVTTAQAYDTVVLVKNLLTEANVTKLIAGQFL